MAEPITSYKLSSKAQAQIVTFRNEIRKQEALMEQYVSGLVDGLNLDGQWALDADNGTLVKKG